MDFSLAENSCIIKFPFCLSTHSLLPPDCLTSLEMPSNPYIHFDEIYSYRMQDTGALIEGPNMFLGDIMALYLFLKNRYTGKGVGWARLYKKNRKSRNISVKI